MSKRKIVHVEIPASDSASASQFYQDLFGWDARRVETPTPYYMFSGGNIGGGYNPLDEQNQPGDILIYIESDDVDADLRAIEAHGGAIIEGPRVVADYGIMAVFTDPTGNRVALWKDTAPQS